MALFYGIRHFEYTYGYTRAGELYYMEQFPGALAELYGGKSASLYLCEEREGMERKFKSKDELLNEEFEKFLLLNKPSFEDDIPALKYYFRALVTDTSLLKTISEGNLNSLSTNPSLTLAQYGAIKEYWRNIIPEYIKDYVPINKFLL